MGNPLLTPGPPFPPSALNRILILWVLICSLLCCGGSLAHFLVKLKAGTFLAVQWLRLCASTAGGHGFDSLSGEEDPVCQAKYK